MLCTNYVVLFISHTINKKIVAQGRHLGVLGGEGCLLGILFFPPNHNIGPIFN